MNAGIAALESFGHQVKICQGAFHKRNVGICLECRDLVGVPSRNHDFVTFFQKGLDHVVTYESCSTCNEYSHTYTSLIPTKYKPFAMRAT